MNEQLPFGLWLKQQRREHALSQEALAEQLHCSLETIRKLEQQTRRPSWQLVDQIAGYFGLPAAERQAFIAMARKPVVEQRPTASAVERELAARRADRIPAPITRFIGRTSDIAAITGRLRDPAVRLLTLLGPGGTGKTRLSIEAARQAAPDFADGVFWVALAQLDDAGQVPFTIAQTMGIWETTGSSVLDHLKEYFGERRLLLVLDNFEQVLAAATVVAELLAAAPGLKVLVTSRTPLRVYGEREWLVPPLSLPSDLATLTLPELLGNEATTLFADRASAVQADFQLSKHNVHTVAEICMRLDGLPLAIELAAARIKTFSPASLLPRLSKPLQILTNGSRDLPARHQTLRNTIDWSYTLLARSEQLLLARMAVFPGSCTLGAISAVCNVDGAVPDPLDGLVALVDNSLLRKVEDKDGEPRYAMLTTIREYASEQLVRTGDSDALQRAHADYYVALIESGESGVNGVDDATWYEQVDLEYPHLRQILKWAADQGITEVTLRLAGELWKYWLSRGYLLDGRSWLEAALAKGTDVPATIRSKALSGASYLAFHQGDYSRANHYYREQLDLARALNDQHGVAFALNGMGVVAQTQGKFAEATVLLEESLAIRQGLEDLRGIASSLNSLARVAGTQGDYPRAQALLEESLRVRRQIGDQRGIGSALNNLGIVAMYQGHYRKARRLHEESLTLLRTLGDQRGISQALANLGYIALLNGDHMQAKTALRQSLNSWRAIGDKYSIADCLEGLAQTCAAICQFQDAARLWGAAEALRALIGAPLPPNELATHDQAVAAAGKQVLTSDWESAWEEGAAMPLKEVIARALVM